MEQREPGVSDLWPRKPITRVAHRSEKWQHTTRAGHSNFFAARSTSEPHSLCAPDPQQALHLPALVGFESSHLNPLAMRGHHTLLVQAPCVSRRLRARLDIRWFSRLPGPTSRRPKSAEVATTSADVVALRGGPARYSCKAINPIVRTIRTIYDPPERAPYRNLEKAAAPNLFVKGRPRPDGPLNV